MSEVTMKVSVGNEPPLVAGETYQLPDEFADGLILKGYADGVLSKEYTEEEAQALRGPTQTVEF
jgi:hypothetical protein